MSDNLKLSLEILRRIPKRWSISAPELRTQLADTGYERSIRTIERQLLTLTEQFEIERDTRSKPYGYKWKENAIGLNMPMMSAQESLLLTLAERYLQNLIPTTLLASLNGYFSQARRTLDAVEMTSQNNKRWLNKVGIVSPTQPLFAARVNADVLETVSTALFQNNWLIVDYQNADDFRQSSRVMPLALVQQDVRLYLVCRFENYDNERNLVLHRIQSVKAQTLTFKYPKEFQLDKYIANGRFGVSDEKWIQLTFEVLADVGKHLIETPLSKAQTVTDKGAYILISADVVDSEMLDRWLCSFGDAVRAIKKVQLE